MLGAPYAYELRSRPGVVAPGLVLGATAGGNLPTVPYGTLRLNPASLVVLAATPSTAAPQSFQLAIPNLPQLTGMSVHLQGLVLDPLDGVRLTNAIVETVQ